MSELKVLDLEYKGTSQVKHFIRILYEEMGLEKIAEKIRHPLSGFSFRPPLRLPLLSSRPRPPAGSIRWRIPIIDRID